MDLTPGSRQFTIPFVTFDLNTHAARLEGKRASKAAVLKAVRALSLEDQREVVLDALLEINALIGDDEAKPLVADAKANGSSAAPRSTPAPGPARQGPPTPEVAAKRTESAEPEDPGEAVGLTEAMIQAIRGAREPINSRQILAEVGRRKPGTELKEILKALHRLVHKEPSPLVRHGQQGSFRYSWKKGAAT